jgi:hypothetical protein
MYKLARRDTTATKQKAQKQQRGLKSADKFQ